MPPLRTSKWRGWPDDCESRFFITRHLWCSTLGLKAFGADISTRRETSIRIGKRLNPDSLKNHHTLARENQLACLQFDSIFRRKQGLTLVHL